MVSRVPETGPAVVSGAQPYVDNSRVRPAKNKRKPKLPSLELFQIVRCGKFDFYFIEITGAAVA